MLKVNVKLNVAGLTKGLQRAKDIVAGSDNMATVEVANMYIELCAEIADGIQADPFTMSLAEQQLDNIDRIKRHSISGTMNNPSPIQIEAFNEENKEINNADNT